MKFSKLLSLGALAAGSVVAVQPAQAATATGNLLVMAQINPSCGVITTPVNFGAINPTLNTAFPATGTFTVTCTNTTGWAATADQGQHSSVTGGGAGFIRAMASTMGGTGLLQYQLFTNAAKTTEFLPSPNGYTGIGTGAGQTQTVYGTVPASQTSVPPDSYLDTVVITVTY